jgi:hypothetical protein
LYLLVLRLGFLQDRNVGVGLFPEGKEILVSGATLRGVALHDIGAGEAEMGECADSFIKNDSAMVEDFLELDNCFAAIVQS